jgi:hypothetical protein
MRLFVVSILKFTSLLQMQLFNSWTHPHGLLWVCCPFWLEHVVQNNTRWCIMKVYILDRPLSLSFHLVWYPPTWIVHASLDPFPLHLQVICVTSNFLALFTKFDCYILKIFIKLCKRDIGSSCLFDSRVITSNPTPKQKTKGLNRGSKLVFR